MAFEKSINSEDCTSFHATSPLNSEAVFSAAPALAVVLPTCNERANTPLLTLRNRVRSREPVNGAARLTLACSLAAGVNVVFARALWQSGASWYIAALFGSAWNLSVSGRFTWRVQRHTIALPRHHSMLYSGLEVSR